MLNQVVLVGRLTRDPEIKILADGKKVGDITLAVQRGFKNMEGSYDTDFIRCSLWEGLATSIETYCKKGVMIALKGRLQTWKYEKEEDKSYTVLEVVAERITFLSSANKTKEVMEE
ncbi:MAG: single-stranded DNA-binding protein [Acholeplasmataceae bacterium]